MNKHDKGKIKKLEKCLQRRSFRIKNGKYKKNYFLKFFFFFFFKLNFIIKFQFLEEETLTKTSYF